MYEELFCGLKLDPARNLETAFAEQCAERT